MLDIKIKFDLDERALHKHIESEVKKRLESVHCAEHGQRPRVTISHRGGEPQFKIEGCCEALVKKATKALQ